MQEKILALIEAQEGLQFLAQSGEERVGFGEPGLQCEMVDMQQRLLPFSFAVHPRDEFPVPQNR